MAERLRVVGNRIVGPSDREVRLRGANVMNYEWYHPDQGALEWDMAAITRLCSSPDVAGWGANLVIIPFASRPVNTGDDFYLKALDAMILRADEASSHRAYVMLAWRSHEVNGSQPPNVDAEARSALVKLARRYRTWPAVLFALQVEAHDVTWLDIRDASEQAIDEMRAVHPDCLVAVSGVEWGRYIGGALDYPVRRESLIYKSHTYDEWPRIKASYQLGLVAARYPVLIGEFGLGSQMTTIDDVSNLLAFAESAHVHWCAWIFHYKAPPSLLDTPKGININARSVIPTGWFPSRPYGELVQDKLRRLYSDETTPVPTPEPSPVEALQAQVAALRESLASSTALAADHLDQLSTILRKLSADIKALDNQEG